jgi:hypothetical protein
VYAAGLGSVRLDAGQAKGKPPAPPPAKPVKPPPTPKQIAKQAAKQAARQVPVDQLQKLLNMSPEDREKNLSKLPPEQRTRAENQLANLDKMSPQQRAQRLEQIRHLETGMAKLSPARQVAVNQEMQSIRKLPAGEARRAAINSPEFQKNFTPDEQQLIREQFPGASK